MVGIQNIIDGGYVFRIRNFQIEIGHVQRFPARFIGGEAFQASNNTRNLIIHQSREVSCFRHYLRALFSGYPVDEVESGLFLIGHARYGQAGDGTKCGARFHAFGMRIFYHSPVAAEGGVIFAALKVCDHGGDKPGTHIHHSHVASGKGSGIVKPFSAEVCVVPADLIVFFLDNHIIIGFEEIIISVQDTVLPVKYAEKLYGASPGMVVCSVNLGTKSGIRHLPCQGVIFLKGHVVGGVIHACGIEDILIIKYDPEIIPEGKLIKLVVYGNLCIHTAVLAQVDPGLRYVIVQRLQRIFGNQRGIAGHILDGNHVKIRAAAGKLCGEYCHVVCGAKIRHFNFDIGMGRFVGIL